MTSCYTQLKYFIIIGWIVGTCPIKNAFRAVNSGILVYKRCSFIYIISWILLLLKIIAVGQAAAVITLIESISSFSSSITDLVAEGVGFGMTFSFGLICQIFLMQRSGKFVSLLKSIDQYDDMYAIPKTKILSKSIITALLHSMVMIIAPNVIMYQMVLSKFPFVTILIVFIHSTNTVAQTLYFIAAFYLVELPASFVYIQIHYLSSVMIHRLENVIEIVEGKSISSSHSTKLLVNQILPKERERSGIFGQGDNAYNSTKFAWNMDAPPFTRNSLQTENSAPKFSSKSWQAISKQYIDFTDLFFRFEEYIGIYYIVLYTCHIVSSVCMIYFCTNWGHPMFSKTANAQETLYFVIIIGLFRIATLANSGEAFEKKHNLLSRVLMRINQEDNFFDDERKQFERFLTVASTVPFRLSAVGFFYVNRGNLTSIVSVIITYIIVLLQFRVSEKSSSSPMPEMNTTNLKSP